MELAVDTTVVLAVCLAIVPEKPQPVTESLDALLQQWRRVRIGNGLGYGTTYASPAQRDAARSTWDTKCGNVSNPPFLNMLLHFFY